MLTLNAINQEQQADYLELLHAYIDSANDAIFVVDGQFHFHIINRLLQDWLGLAASDTHSRQNPLTISTAFRFPDSGEYFTDQLQLALQGQAVRFECQIHPLNRPHRWVDISLNRVECKAGMHVIGVMRDTTATHRLLEHIQYQAQHDELTGLPNRRAFHQQLETLITEAKIHSTEHALLYIDLDQFKVVNDTCGHLTGDALLHEVAHRITNAIRPDDFLARLGGDEFGLLLHNCSGNAALETAEAIRQALASKRFTWQEQRFEITCSTGVCSISKHSSSGSAVLSAADAACHAAKDEGRNRSHINQDGAILSAKQREMEWVSRLIQALDENRFCLYYQEIHPLADPHLKQHREVLLRLRSDSGEIIPPGQFLPAAEKYHLMPAIDRWVISHVFAALGSSRAGEHACYTINLAGTSLADSRLAEFIRNQATEHDINPEHICFEITETEAISNLNETIALLHELRAMGFHCALDDFGSGMSSFNYLKSLPANILKIDGGLVQDVVSSNLNRSMVESIHRIAKEIGMLTVAEYVDNELVLQQLQQIGIDFVQGYHLHRPQPLN